MQPKDPICDWLKELIALDRYEIDARNEMELRRMNARNEMEIRRMNARNEIEIWRMDFRKETEMRRMDLIREKELAEIDLRKTIRLAEINAATKQEKAALERENEIRLEVEKRDRKSVV